MKTESSFNTQKKNVERFLNHILIGSSLGWCFYDLKTCSDIYIYDKQETKNVNLRIKIHFILNGKFNSNPPNYNLPPDVITFKEIMDFLEKRNLHFLIIKCYGDILYPRQFYIGRYIDIPSDELKTVSRHGIRVDRIEVASHKWYDKRMELVGWEHSHLIHSLQIILKSLL